MSSLKAVKAAAELAKRLAARQRGGQRKPGPLHEFDSEEDESSPTAAVQSEAGRAPQGSASAPKTKASEAVVPSAPELGPPPVKGAAEKVSSEALHEAVLQLPGGTTDKRKTAREHIDQEEIVQSVMGLMPSNPNFGEKGDDFSFGHGAEANDAMVPLPVAASGARVEEAASAGDKRRRRGSAKGRDLAFIRSVDELSTYSYAFIAKAMEKLPDDVSLNYYTAEITDDKLAKGMRLCKPITDDATAARTINAIISRHDGLLAAVRVRVSQNIRAYNTRPIFGIVKDEFAALGHVAHELTAETRVATVVSWMTNDGDFITRLLKTIPETLPFTLHRPVGRLAYLFGVALVQAALDKMGRAPLLAPPEAGDAELEPPPLETVTRAVQFGGALRDDSIVPRSLTSKVHPAVLAVFNSGVVEPAARAMNWGHVLTRCAQIAKAYTARSAVAGLARRSSTALAVASVMDQTPVKPKTPLALMDGDVGGDSPIDAAGTDGWASASTPSRSTWAAAGRQEPVMTPRDVALIVEGWWEEIAVGSIQLDEAKIHMSELRGKLGRQHPAPGAVSKIMVAAAQLAKSASTPFGFTFDETSKLDYTLALEASLAPQ